MSLGWLAVLAAAAALAVALPLLRGGSARPAAPRPAHDAAVYRAQLAELAREREVGRIAPGDYDAAVLEVERRLLSLPEPAPSPPARPLRWPLLAGALLVPALALLFYLPRGTPGMPDFPLAAVSAERAAEEAQLDQLVGALRARLAAMPADNPQRAPGLVLLGNAERSRGNLAAAADAYRGALAAGFEPATAIALAEVLALSADGRITPEARPLLERAAAAGTADPRADYYLGLADRQAGDLPGALARWRALARRSPADAPWMPGLGERIAEAEAAAGAAAPPDALAMVERLRTRLSSTPDDGEGWLRLARAERVLGNHDAASAALAQAERLLPGDARIAAERRALAGG